MISRKHRARILTPVNGTPASKHAFRWACQLARHSHADLIAIYVSEVPMEYAVESIKGRSNLMEGEEILRQVEKIAGSEHCKVEASMIAARNAGPALVLEAETRSVDLLVVGLPYREGVVPVSVGSTADFILKNAPCQVIVSREPALSHAGSED
ncbi:MAG: universal stress protein [Chloroflexota bacterium]|nr:universal stress protein [Chloroflexota bacterium]